MGCGLRARAADRAPRRPVSANATTVHGYHIRMTTKLETTIKREIEIDGEPFTVAISPTGLRLTRKRFRSGVALSWKALLRLANHSPSSADGTTSASDD